MIHDIPHTMRRSSRRHWPGAIDVIMTRYCNTNGLYYLSLCTLYTLAFTSTKGVGPDIFDTYYSFTAFSRERERAKRRREEVIPQTDFCGGLSFKFAFTTHFFGAVFC